MWRQEQQPDQGMTGYLPVSLFNQRKRNRVPLKSVPGENEFFSPGEFMASTGPAAPLGPSGTYGGYQVSDSFSSAPQSHQWNRKGVAESTKAQQYGSSRPAPGPSAARAYAPLPHPYKAVAKSSVMGQTSNPVGRWDSSSGGSSRHGRIQHPYGKENSKSQPTQPPGFSQMAQQSTSKQTVSARQYSQQPRPLPPPPPPQAPPSRPSAQAAQQPNKSWKFTSSFEQQTSFVKKSSTQPPTARPAKYQPEASPVKPAMENSLRILTTVINGMRHWSQFKDKIPYLFEIFATLDSAVTLGRYGAKNFLMRDGKDVLQCVFYENEQVLPRLIRGQVHRCVGNYDRARDVLICVSVRAALPSEQRNALEAVKVSDAEMRGVVKVFSEV
uniref:Spermatogenesis associated 22 n=1 Tax=Fundulus heteroclitus TaxID=8078 RepID=A0A3Q2QD00_FUNHE